MDRCQTGCHNEMFNCLCHKRPTYDCNCQQESCHCKQNIVKDCVCVEWSVLHGRTQTVFQTGGFTSIFASGFISFDGGSSDSVIVRFFLADRQVGSSVRIFRESSTAFSFTEFDKITVECAQGDPNIPGICEGELCITTRYFM